MQYYSYGGYIWKKINGEAHYLSSYCNEWHHLRYVDITRLKAIDFITALNYMAKDYRKANFRNNKEFIKKEIKEYLNSL